MKKLLYLLAIAALIITLPACSGKIKSAEIDGIVWNYEELEDGTLKIYPQYQTGEDGTRIYTSELINVTVPSEIKGKEVSMLGEQAFLRADSLVSIEVPQTVTTIGRECFYGCTALTQITLSQGLTSIDNEAFGMCSSLSEISLPSSLSSMGENVFGGCENLTEINAEQGQSYVSEGGVLFSADMTCLEIYPSGNQQTEYSIPQGTKTIGKYAFTYAVNLEKIYIPSSVTDIQTTFDMSMSLNQIEVTRNNLNFMSVDGILYNRDKSVLIKYPQGKKDSEFTIPYSVNEISAYAFGSEFNLGGSRYLNSVTITDNVDKIGQFAFANCNMLNYVYFTSRPSDIGNAAFTGLKNVIISVNAEYKDYFTASLTALDTSAIITSEAAIQSGGYDVDISYEMIKIGDYEYFCEIGKRNNESVTFIMRRDARDTEEILFEITGQYRFDYIADTYEGSDYQYLYFTARDMSKIYSHSEIYAFDISAKSFSRLISSPCSAGLVVISNTNNNIEGIGWALSDNKIVAVNLKEARINEYLSYTLPTDNNAINNFFSSEDTNVVYVESSVYALDDSTLEIKTEYILDNNAGMKTEYYKYDCVKLKFSGPFEKSSL